MISHEENEQFFFISKGREDAQNNGLKDFQTIF